NPMNRNSNIRHKGTKGQRNKGAKGQRHKGTKAQRKAKRICISFPRSCVGTAYLTLCVRDLTFSRKVA
ncbi:MAG: hypothetical protein KAR47_11400, partial [Planctomycetes bacterium]|nr:hypothetical protein [Planctomycetota bacterium]